MGGWMNRWVSSTYVPYGAIRLSLPGWPTRPTSYLHKLHFPSGSYLYTIPTAPCAEARRGHSVPGSLSKKAIQIVNHHLLLIVLSGCLARSRPSSSERIVVLPAHVPQNSGDPIRWRIADMSISKSVEDVG